MYEYDAGTTTWVQLGNDIDGEAIDDGSGVSVALGKNTFGLIRCRWSNW